MAQVLTGLAIDNGTALALAGQVHEGKTAGPAGPVRRALRFLGDQEGWREGDRRAQPEQETAGSGARPRCPGAHASVPSGPAGTAPSELVATAGHSGRRPSRRTTYASIA